MLTQEQELSYMIYITITSILGMISLLLMIHLIYKICTTTSKISKLFRLGTSSHHLDVQCLCCDLIHYISSFTLNVDLLLPQQDILIIIVIANISYYVGCIFFYILLIMRVYTGFKGTKYEISRCVYFSLWFLILTSVLASIWHVSIMIDIYPKSRFRNKT